MGEKLLLPFDPTLGVNESIKGLAEQLLKHGYEIGSIIGSKNGSEACVAFKGGDGWFEKNAVEFGFRKAFDYYHYGNRCEKFEAENEDAIYCGNCGAAINGNVGYVSI